MNSF
ncbi:hypothetical protein BpHYR1_007701 [Brachionus plicatilis]|jgi:hypothetical protein